MSSLSIQRSSLADTGAGKYAQRREELARRLLERIGSA
jgi:hypothetical protein